MISKFSKRNIASFVLTVENLSLKNILDISTAFNFIKEMKVLWKYGKPCTGCNSDF